MVNLSAFLNQIHNNQIIIMNKLLHSHPLFSFSNMKYIIKNKKYLVEAPPDRPMTSYALFIKESTQGSQKLNIADKSAELSKLWKQNAETRDKYTNQYKNQRKEYEEKLQAYELKYPFKSVTFMSLVSKFYQNNNANKLNELKAGLDLSTQQTQIFKEMSPIQKIQLIQESIKNREDNKRKLQKYVIPPRRYQTFQDFQKKNKRTSKKENQFMFNFLEDEWRKAVEAWLKTKGYSLTLEEFLTMYLTAVKEQARLRRRQVSQGKAIMANIKKSQAVELKKQQPKSIQQVAELKVAAK